MRPEAQRGTVRGELAWRRMVERRLADLERDAVPVPTDPPLAPLAYSWSGPVAALVGIASSPGLFSAPGVIYRVDYRFGVAAAVTVVWRLDGVVVATHSPAVKSHVAVSVPYGGEDLVATVTADAGAVGLTAFVFLR